MMITLCAPTDRLCRMVAAAVLLVGCATACRSDADSGADNQASGSTSDTQQSANDDESGSLCASDIASQFSEVLAAAGHGEYAFTSGSSDGDGCLFETTYNGEPASSRTLSVVLTDESGVPSSDACKWGYQIDSDSYSWCGRFEIYWSFYTEEFVGSSNRLDEAATLALHMKFWDVLNQALDEGRVATDVAGEEAAAAEASASAAAEELGDLSRDDSGCVSAAELNALTGSIFSTATGSPSSGCVYDLVDYSGTRLTIGETDSGLGNFEELDWDTWYEGQKELVGDWFSGLSGAGKLVSRDGEFAEWEHAIGRGKVGHDGTLWTVLVQWPASEPFQDLYADFSHNLWDAFDQAYRLAE